MKIGIIGAGGWGTSLSVVLDSIGHEVILWGRNTTDIKRWHENKKYLPGVKLNDSIKLCSDKELEAEIYIASVPVQHMRSVLRSLVIDKTKPIISASKGIELERFRRPSEIIQEETRCKQIFVLSGPSHAEEVARFLPTSLVVASKNDTSDIQKMLNSKTIRIYILDDILGVEYAGALKNIIAIAAGISDGLYLGDNAKASLLSRAVVEMARFGESMGAKKGTFYGLAGLGDLMTTCHSPFGRNLRVGREIGGGRTLEDVFSTMNQVAEGVETTRAVYQLAKLKSIEMPITSEVYSVLFEKKPPREALFSLMSRKLKKEEI